MTDRGPGPEQRHHPGAADPPVVEGSPDEVSSRGDCGEPDRGGSSSPVDKMDPESDRWLVERAQSGEPQAWEVLIRRHHRRIYRIALRILGDPDDAEDVAQDVVITMFTALAGFSNSSSFTTWLYRIVVNRSLNHRRRRRPTRPILESDHPPVDGPERTVLARGEADATAEALANLSAELRSALVLHEMEGLSYAEVAGILGISESSVRGRIYRARRVLLGQLRGWS